jgi:hypothetical protein
MHQVTIKCNHIMLYRVHLAMILTLVMIGTACKSNYHTTTTMTTTTVVPKQWASRL